MDPSKHWRRQDLASRSVDLVGFQGLRGVPCSVSENLAAFRFLVRNIRCDRFCRSGFALSPGGARSDSKSKNRPSNSWRDSGFRQMIGVIMHCVRQERKERRPPVMRNAERVDS